VLHVELQVILIELQLITRVPCVVVLAMVENRRVLVDLIREHPQVYAERLKAIVISNAVTQDAAVVVVEKERAPFHAVVERRSLEYRGRRARRAAGTETQRVAYKISWQSADPSHDLLQFFTGEFAAIRHQIPQFNGPSILPGFVGTASSHA
jgi:hypothetical protein